MRTINALLILEKQFCQFARELFFIEGGFWYCCRILFLEAWESNKAFFFGPDHPIIFTDFGILRSVFNRLSTRFMPLVSSYLLFGEVVFLMLSGGMQRDQLHGSATLIKKRLWHRCFLVNCTNFLRTRFLQNTSGGYFWKWVKRPENTWFQLSY